MRRFPGNAKPFANEVIVMIDDANRLDDALTQRHGGLTAEAPIQALVHVAGEVSDALGSLKLTGAQRERIQRRVEELLQGEGRWLAWSRRLHLNRRSGAVLGGAAVVTLAAIGYVVHERRHHEVAV